MSQSDVDAEEMRGLLEEKRVDKLLRASKQSDDERDEHQHQHVPGPHSSDGERGCSKLCQPYLPGEDHRHGSSTWDLFLDLIIAAAVQRMAESIMEFDHDGVTWEMRLRLMFSYFLPLFSTWLHYTVWASRYARADIASGLVYVLAYLGYVGWMGNIERCSETSMLKLLNDTSMPHSDCADTFFFLAGMRVPLLLFFLGVVILSRKHRRFGMLQSGWFTVFW